MTSSSYNLTHLKVLEAESIHILREVAAEFERPVMLLLYRQGLRRNAAAEPRKAFHPRPTALPALACRYEPGNSGAMIEFRDRYCREQGLDLKVWINQQGLAQGINPFDHGSKTHTDIMKTAALKQALNHYQFDAAFGDAPTR